MNPAARTSIISAVDCANLTKPVGVGVHLYANDTVLIYMHLQDNYDFHR